MLDFLMPWPLAGLAGALALLQLGDVLSTLLVLRRGGRELNPLVRWCMALRPDQPWVGLLLSKLLLCPVLAHALARMSLPEARGVLQVLVALYLPVVIHNLLVARRLRSLRGQP